MSDPYPFVFGQEIRFIGGKYNGFIGLVRLSGPTQCQVEIKIEGKPFDVVESCDFMTDNQQWIDSLKTPT
jgi:hypothetical protein